MEKEEYQKIYKQYETEIKELTDKQKKSVNEYAKEYCPYNIGQIVEIKGYSHRGKKCIIDYIAGATWCGDINWKVGGFVLNKNGEKSKRYVYWQEYQDK